MERKVLKNNGKADRSCSCEPQFQSIAERVKKVFSVGHVVCLEFADELVDDVASLRELG